MSVKAMSWVWSHSRSKPTQRLVLLAIADCANDRGREAYPSNASLMHKTGLSERGVRKAVTELEELGELAVEYKGGPHGCNRYRIIMADPAPGAGSDTDSQTRHDVPGERSTRHGMPGTRNDVHPARHAGDPAPGAADPAPHAENPAPGAPEPSEPSENRQEPSESVPAAPARREPEPHRPDVEDLCRHLADRIEANGSKRPTVTKRWRQAARLMIDVDHRTTDQVRRAIDWCQDDEFWRANVMSMPKLRAKYDQLRLAALRTRASPAGQPRPSTSDQRVQAALAAGASLQAKLDQQLPLREIAA